MVQYPTVNDNADLEFLPTPRNILVPRCFIFALKYRKSL